MTVDYDNLSSRLTALCAGETDYIALMASIACEVFHSDSRFDWVGFYRNIGDETLKIGPYQGGHGCLEISFLQGVCGAAARTGQVQIVPDVDAFEGHIACASSTRSELVIPFYDQHNGLIGVFDIDSDLPDAFSQTDADQMGRILNLVFR